MSTSDRYNHHDSVTRGEGGRRINLGALSSFLVFLAVFFSFPHTFKFFLVFIVFLAVFVLIFIILANVADATSGVLA